MSAFNPHARWVSREDAEDNVASDPREERPNECEAKWTDWGWEPPVEIIEEAFRMEAPEGRQPDEYARVMKQKLQKNLRAVGGWARYGAMAPGAPGPGTRPANAVASGSDPKAQAPVEIPPQETRKHAVMCWCRLGNCPRAGEIRCWGVCCTGDSTTGGSRTENHEGHGRKAEGWMAGGPVTIKPWRPERLKVHDSLGVYTGSGVKAHDNKTADSKDEEPVHSIRKAYDPSYKTLQALD